MSGYVLPDLDYDYGALDRFVHDRKWQVSSFRAAQPTHPDPLQSSAKVTCGSVLRMYENSSGWRYSI